MKIVIDGRFLGPEGLGIGKYVEQLLSNLEKIDNKNEYSVLLRKENYHQFKPGRNFEKVLADANWYSSKEQILIPRILSKEKPDLVHFTHFNVPLAWRGKFVVTIHDLILSEYSKEVSKSSFYPIYLTKNILYNLTFKKATTSSERILSPSSFVKNEILKNYKTKKEKITVTHEAADEFFIAKNKEKTLPLEKKKVLSKHKIKEPYVLTVGNSYPYKNIETVIKSLSTLSSEISLVHLSKRDHFAESLTKLAKRSGVSERFHITGYVTKEELYFLYRQAQAFIFPSLSEGFGLPGLEAMASGCPVLASDIVVFREIYGEAAEYFEPKDPDDLAKKIQFIIHNSEFRVQLINKGFNQVKKYSWNKLAQQTLEVYSSLL